MKVSQIIAYLALGTSAVFALPTEEVVEREVEIEARNLPGLNAVQTKYANAIIAQAKKDGVGAHGCQAGIATAMVEVCASHSLHNSIAPPALPLLQKETD